MQARGAVHVSGRRDYGAFLRAHRIGKGHERRRVRLLEKFADCLFGDGWREGAKDFAVLDAAIQNFLHFRAARIGENAAIAQRARSPFRSTLKPAHDFSGGDVARGCFDQRRFVEVRNLRVPRSNGDINRFAHFRRRVLRAPIGVVHGEFARAAQNLMVNSKGGADGETCVARGGLHVNAFERTRVENLSVGNAIEGNATSQAQRFLSGRLRKPVPARPENFFESRLHARGEIVVPRRERLIRLASGSEPLFEIGRKNPTEYRACWSRRARSFRSLAFDA